MVTADNKNCIDLNRLCLDLEVSLYNPDGKDAATPDNILFSNNTLHSLFSHVELFLNGKLISSSNNNYHHAAFVETEWTKDTMSKKTWASCQSYQYRPNKQKIFEIKDGNMKKFSDLGKCSLHIYGGPHVDFLDCERVLPPGVTLHLRF